MNRKVYDEWLKINVEIHNKLEDLKKLDNERNKLIKEVEEKGINEEIKEKMDESVKKYNYLLEEIKLLNLKAYELKNKV